MTNRIMRNRYHANVTDICTIVAVVCLEILDVCTGFVDILFVKPRVRSSILTDGNGVTEYVGRMDDEREAVNTIATER